MLSPFPVSNPSLSPCFYEVAPQPTYPLLPPCPGIHVHLGTKPSQDQGPPFPLVSDKAILCYIYIWIHRSLPSHSLVGGLVSESTGWSGQSMLFFLGLQSPSAPPVLPPASPPWSLSSKHPHLHWSVAGQASQRTATPGFCQQVSLGNSNKVWVWGLQTG